MTESKNESPSTSETPRVSENDSLMGVFLGMFWLLWGNIILVSMAVKISQQHTFSTYDIIYWVTVALLAITRYCDIKFFKGITIRGSQATMKHWRKYILYLLLASVVLWILANGLSVLKK